MIKFSEGVKYFADPTASSFDQRLSFRLQQAGIKNPNLLLTNQDRRLQYDKLIGMTGNTPITRHENPNGTILMKRLSQNPSECHYDLVYLNTLRFLEEQGIIWPTNKNEEHNGQNVELVELTSGSAGISFGFATKMLGFKGTLFVPEEIPDARVDPMKSFGLDIVRTPPGYVKVASEKLGAYFEQLKADGYKSVKFDRQGNRSLVYEKDKHRVCFINHSENQITIDAFKTVGQEIADFLPEGVRPGALLTIIGNFTSSTGISSILKNRYPDIQLVGLESVENPNWFDQRYPGEFEKRFGRPPTFNSTRIYGTSQRGVPLYFGYPKIFNDIQLLEPEDVIIAWQKEYNEGKPWVETIGRSTAASLMMAERYTKKHPGSIVVVLNYDKADRYEEQVIEHVPAMNFNDALARNRFDPGTIQPIGWKQSVPRSPINIPISLKGSYSSYPLAV